MKLMFALLFAAAASFGQAGAQSGAAAQPPRDLGAERQQALDLMKKAQPLAALPLVEDLVAANPDDATALGWLAYCLFAKSRHDATADQAPAILKRAGDAARRAKQLGNQWPLLDELLSIMNSPGAAQPSYSSNEQVNARMKEGEDAFSRGDNARALAAYAAALQLDPKLYTAALFAGDICFRTKDLPCASQWFGKAIAIDPDKETAYRYWGDALMAAGKMMEARDQFIESIIAEPSQKPWASLMNWAKQNHSQLTAPKIERPPVTDKPQTVDINVQDLQDKEGTGRGAWVQYAIVRGVWRQALFAKTYPSGKEYRHTLAEETAALAAVADTLDRQKADHIDPQLMNVVLLKRDGLLEAWILLSGGPDPGIGQDYVAYRAAHHAELRAYIDKYIIHSAP